MYLLAFNGICLPAYAAVVTKPAHYIHSYRSSCGIVVFPPISRNCKLTEIVLGDLTEDVTQSPVSTYRKTERSKSPDLQTPGGVVRRPGHANTCDWASPQAVYENDGTCPYVLSTMLTHDWNTKHTEHDSFMSEELVEVDVC